MKEKRTVGQETYPMIDRLVLVLLGGFGCIGLNRNALEGFQT